MAAVLRPRVIHLQHEMFLFGGVTSMATFPFAASLMRSFEGAAVTTVHQVVDVDHMGPEMMRMHRFRGPVTAARTAMRVYQGVFGSTGVTIVHEPGFERHISGGVVIPHGVENGATPTRAQGRQQLGMMDEKRLVVLCFGFVAPYKGLEAALAVAADIPEMLLVVAGGDHPRHGSAYTATLKRRWGDTAHFTGWVPEEDIGAWYSASDLALFCYPAPHSSSGAVAMALAHRTPFLASEALARCMGLPREVGVSLDHEPLAARLRGLAADRDALTGLGDAAGRISSGRTWPHVARRHLRLYEEAIRGTSEKPPDGSDDSVEDGRDQLAGV
jgi:glycosyltransferase involved in cell wall biosynthesis